MSWEVEAPLGPVYPDLGTGVTKFRRKAAKVGAIKEMLASDRRAYGEAVERAILAKQKQALQRELPSHAPSCASGTAYSDGEDISAAIRQQHRSSLQAYVARARRARTPAQWKELYEQAMKEKRNAQAHKTDAGAPDTGLLRDHPKHLGTRRRAGRSPRRARSPAPVADRGHEGAGGTGL